MRSGFVLAMLALVLGSLQLPAGETAAAAKSALTLTDTGGDDFGEEARPIDVVKVDLSSDGKFLLIATALAKAPKPASPFEALILGLAIDSDNNRKTGGQGFGGMTGDVPGIEFESEILASIESDEGISKSSAASVIAVDQKGNQSNVRLSSDASRTPAKGKTYTGKIAYADIGVKPGQVIRLVVRELSDRGEMRGVFPEVLLKLK